jgi:hypothetical protein
VPRARDGITLAYGTEAARDYVTPPPGRTLRGAAAKVVKRSLDATTDEIAGDLPRAVTASLAAFVDALPVPRRLVAAEHDGRLTVRLRGGAHRYHRDLPESKVWGYDGTVPGPTIEAERGRPVTVQWSNELDNAVPVLVTIPEFRPSHGRSPPGGWRGPDRRSGPTRISKVSARRQQHHPDSARRAH